VASQDTNDLLLTGQEVKVVVSKEPSELVALVIPMQGDAMGILISADDQISPIDPHA
jgi:hypothetical protein